MPRAPKNIESTATPAGTRTTITKEPIEKPPTEDTTLDEFFESLGGGAQQVRLFLLDESGEQSFIGERSIEGFDLAEIQRSFGPGRYLARPMDPENPKRFLAGKNRTRQFRIAAPGGAAAPQKISSGPDPMSAMMAMMLKQSAMETQRLHELMLAMVGRPAEAKNSSEIGELLGGLKTLKELEGGGSRFSEIKEILEIAGMLGSGNGGGATPWDTLSKILPALVGKNGAPGPHALNAPDPRAVAEIPETREPSPEPPAAPQPGIIGRVILAARRDRDPGVYADLVIEEAELGDAEAAQLAAAALNGGDRFWPMMARDYELDPALKSWFDDFQRAVIQVTRDAEQQPANSGRAETGSGWDPADASGDGDAGAERIPGAS